MADILFIFGPSGVGKTFTSEGLVQQYSFIHIDIDERNMSGFEKHGFPGAWDKDMGTINFTHLAAEARRRIEVDQRAGAVLSFPTNYIFSLDQLAVASDAGIATVVLWGIEEHCKEARRKRRRFDENRYDRLNKHTFETYSLPAYADLSVEAFQPDGSHWPPESILATIMNRIKP